MTGILWILTAEVLFAFMRLATRVNANALRPYLGFSTITLYETTGKSRYNALQTQIERRSSRGVGFRGTGSFMPTSPRVEDRWGIECLGSCGSGPRRVWSSAGLRCKPAKQSPDPGR